jgi:hypothetical protein
MQSGKHVAKSLARTAIMVWARLKLSRIVAEELMPDFLGMALADAFHHRMDSDERLWIHRIERRRVELDSSTDSVSFVDYGAGSAVVVQRK